MQQLIYAYYSWANKVKRLDKTHNMYAYIRNTGKPKTQFQGTTANV